MKDQKKAEEIAALRVQLLSPLLADGLDPAKARQIKTQRGSYPQRCTDYSNFGMGRAGFARAT
nr:hypothetical protein [Desulfotomaculum nigrificans]